MSQKYIKSKNNNPKSPAYGKKTTKKLLPYGLWNLQGEI